MYKRAGARRNDEDSTEHKSHQSHDAMVAPCLAWERLP